MASRARGSSGANITAEPEASEISIRETLDGDRSSAPLRYHRKKDGTVFPVEISAGTFVLSGRRVLCGVVRDITERRRAEEVLRATEKLAATGRVAARIAHEISNPLGGIMNSFLLIKDAIEKDHPHYDYVVRIEREIGRLARIVRQMFNVYRPETEGPTEFVFDDVLRDIVALLESECRVHGVTIAEELSEAGIRVFLERDSVVQVLFNVIENAIEASPKGGKVKVAISTAEERLEVSVADEGSGIPEDVREHIFEPFFTTKPISGRTKAGSGLGLPTSLGLVQAMGGSLDFTSEAGQGTVFRIRLPLDQRQSPQGEPEP